MAYLCRDCSYRGTEAGVAGECPACGSRNFGRRKNQAEEAPSNNKLRLQILVVVWTIFIGMVIWKLIQ